MNMTSIKNEKLHTDTEQMENAELLVLPPNVLQKLGISLNNLSAGSKQASNSKHLKKANINKVGTNPKRSSKTKSLKVKKEINYEKKESSLSETASLMKKSLFLSPTFSRENNGSLIESFQDIYDSEQEVFEVLVIDTEAPINDNNIINSNSKRHSENMENDQHEIINCLNMSQDKIVMKYPCDNKGIQPNYNLKSQHDDNELSFNLQNESTKLYSKNILDNNIKSQTVNSYKSLESSNSYIKNDDDIPLSKFLENECNMKDALTKLNIPRSKTHNFVDSDINCNNKCKDKIVSNNNFEYKEITNCQGNVSNTNIQSKTSENSESVINSHNDLQLEKHILNEVHSENGTIKLVPYSKSNISPCKLSIQGVEKPGGHNSYTIIGSPEHKEQKFMFSSDIKTYKNIKKGHTERKINIVLPKTTIKENNINVISSTSDNTEQQSYCNCFDFGNFNFNCEINSNYQHIHLQSNSSVNINAEYLFEKGDITQEKSLDEFDGDITESVDTNNMFICWVSTVSANSEDVTVENYERVQKRRQKRIRASTDSNSSNDMPLSKLSKSKNINVIHNEVSNDCQTPDTISNESEEKHKCLNVSEVSDVGMVVCGVCHLHMVDNEWFNHIQVQHQYLAWKKGDREVNIENTIEVGHYLRRLSKTIGGLKCHKCGIKMSYAKSYLRHIKHCEPQESINNNNINESQMNATDDNPENILVKEEMVTCAVCRENIENREWISHIQSKHDYMAWKEGDTPLDLNNKEFIKDYLYNVCKKNNGLVCSKCGLVRKYLNPYLQHMKLCDGSEVLDVSQTDENGIFHKDGEVTCGVCKKNIEYRKWIQHIQEEHNYFAWISGVEVLDLKNEDSILAHLNRLLPIVNVFVCKYCGLHRKKVVPFYKHSRVCTFMQNSSIKSEPMDAIQGNVLDTKDESFVKKEGKVSCGVCNASVKEKEWTKHSLNEHFNLAWIKGSLPIDLKNPYEVEKLLKVYKNKYFKFVCKICKISRVSALGFYAHYLVCGKTNEEIDEVKETCSICQNKYLCIYRQQHKRWHEGHEDVENNTPPKENSRKLRELNKLRTSTKTISEHDLRKGRKAANKARAVFQQFIDDNIELNGMKFNCQNCSFKTNKKLLFKNHECGDGDDSDESVRYDDSSTDSDDYRKVQDDTPEVAGKRKRTSEQSASNLKPPLPFDVPDVQNYLSESLKDFCQANFSEEVLYPEWIDSEMEMLNAEEREPYMPQLVESCKLSLFDQKWVTLEPFEVVFGKSVSTVFLGGRPLSLAWAPSSNILDKTEHDEYLAVAVNINYKTVNYDQLSMDENVIQLWNFGNFRSPPLLSLRVAHKFGSIHALRWCPSGARSPGRLGLLALASSDGCVHILSIPLCTNSAAGYCKIKSVAELRLCMTEQRKKYQATSLEWSMKKGHSVIIVGYSNGVVAHYDLNIDSPILRKVEDGLTIVYSYHEDHPLKSAVLSLSNFAFVGGLGTDAYCAASWAGVTIRARAGPMPLLQLGDPTMVMDVCPTPHWPSVSFACDETTLMKRYIEFTAWGDSRRVPVFRRLAGCAHCGEVVGLAPPLLIAQPPPHPAAPHSRRPQMVIEMAPINKRKTKRVTDELTVKLEPITYEETIKKYGMKIYPLTAGCEPPRLDRPPAGKFSLSEPVAMEFCPSAAHHTRLAVATLSGVLVVLPFSYS